MQESAIEDSRPGNSGSGSPVATESRLRAEVEILDRRVRKGDRQRRAMLHIVSPRCTTCTCGRREERSWPSTRAAASNTFAGNDTDEEGICRSDPTVSGPVGRSFISRTTLTVVLNRLATDATESPRTTV